MYISDVDNSMYKSASTNVILSVSVDRTVVMSSILKIKDDVSYS